MQKLRLVSQALIKQEEWDKCVENTSVQGYEYYHNLQATQQVWQGLIYGDYEAVFPVFVRKKFGFSYCFQPLPLQAFSICFRAIEREEVVIAVVDFLKQEFSLLDICINLPQNYGNKEAFQERDNYYLDLSKPATQLVANYSKKIIPLLKKAETYHLKYEHCDLSTAFQFLLKELFPRVDSIAPKEYVNLKNYFENALLQQKLLVKSVSIPNGSLIAVGLFYQSNRAICYLKGVANEQGRSLSASHYLLANLISENAGQDIRFDFAGSTVPSIAFFFRSFGANKHKYYRLQFQRLPKLVLLVRKLHQQFFN